MNQNKYIALGKNEITGHYIPLHSYKLLKQCKVFASKLRQSGVYAVCVLEEVK